MNQNLTEIAFMLDRSGSMAALADEAIGAFNSFLNDQNKNSRFWQHLMSYLLWTRFG